MTDDSSSSIKAPASAPDPDTEPEDDQTLGKAVRRWFGGGRKPTGADTSVRDTLTELIEERDDAALGVNQQERVLLANILDLRDRTVEDVMVPRAEIIAVDAASTMDAVIDLLTRAGHSRLPVFRETLDDAMGMVHIKDVMAWRGRDEDFDLAEAARPVLFVSPSMHVLELLLEMRAKRCHMALVVDEYGGVDGLVTIEDLVEEIVGEIEDEFDRTESPTVTQRADGTIDAEARLEIEDLEALIGAFTTEEEREECDTLGGLVFALAGRVPIRGELITHPGGLEFEVLDADPRRIKRLRVHGRPAAAEASPK